MAVNIITARIGIRASMHFKINLTFFFIMYVVLLVLNIFSSNNGGNFTNVIVYIIPSTLVISLLGFDEKSNWESYINELPLTYKDNVNAKYIIGTLFILIGIITGLLGSLIFNISSAIEVFVLSVIASCLSFAFTVPIYFRFGSNMGRIAYYLVIMVASMMIAIINSVDILSIIPSLSHILL